MPHPFGIHASVGAKNAIQAFLHLGVYAFSTITRKITKRFAPPPLTLSLGGLEDASLLEVASLLERESFQGGLEVALLLEWESFCGGGEVF
ncbi:MAG: hypothetical protein K5656_08365 [Lachnospiraceae bacterium]|nr:hypothetical protein [Lachnospiraceae bacterium]